jgi:hypothetical protein
MVTWQVDGYFVLDGYWCWCLLGAGGYFVLDSYLVLLVTWRTNRILPLQLPAPR